MNREMDIPFRRTVLKLVGAIALASALDPLSAFGYEKQFTTYRSKANGCFMGAAIADAMGGPVECQHYKRIAKYFPDFQEHQPCDQCLVKSCSIEVDSPMPERLAPIDRLDGAYRRIVWKV